LATLHWLHVPERVQNRGEANVQSASRQRATIRDLLSPSLTYPVGELCGQQVPAAWSRRPSRCLLLAAVPFRLPQLKSGTVCQESVVSSSSMKTFRRQLKLIFLNFHTLT